MSAGPLWPAGPAEGCGERGSCLHASGDDGGGRRRNTLDAPFGARAQATPFALPEGGREFRQDSPDWAFFREKVSATPLGEVSGPSDLSH